MTNKDAQSEKLKKLFGTRLSIHSDTKPDPKTKNEQEEYDRAAKAFELSKKQSEHAQRERYAENLFWMACAWIIIVLVIVIATGIVPLNPYFMLSDKVLIALLTSTTVSVIGMFGIVLKYLFGNGK